MEFCLRAVRRLIPTLAVLFLAACGGGGGNTPPPSGGSNSPAPSGLSYPAMSAWVVGQEISPVTPTVSGSVTSYSVSPALPAGVVLNATSGVLSGRPTAVAATANYTVTASNSSGSTTATVAITVNDTAPTISYAKTNVTFTSGVPVQPLVPQHTGGAPVNWQVTPALPAGLSLSTTDGTISGTPTNVTAAASYLVTATNSGGQSQVELSITVMSGVLLELGHSHGVDLLRMASDRALSQDAAGHWTLWDVPTGEIVAAGNTPCANQVTPTFCERYMRADMMGDTVAIQKADGLEMRSATDGTVIANIQAQLSSWSLASDGSYVVAVDATALTAWSKVGVVRVTRPGNYSNAAIFAAPGEIRVARGAAGVDVIETIALASGASTTSPQFAGQFHKWFVDGERFLTKLNTTVWVYSRTAVQQDLATLSASEVTGQGNWFWATSGNTTSVYAVGNSSTAAETYNSSGGALASGLKLAITEGVRFLRIVDLSGTTLSSTQHQLPINHVSTFASSNGSWLVANSWGVVLDGSSLAGTPRYLALGAALDIAGGSERVAIATASGTILYFNANTRVLEGTIPLYTRRLQMSSDGTVLAALRDRVFPTESDVSVHVYALPAATTVNSWPYEYGVGNFARNITLSSDGAVLSRELVTDYPAMKASIHEVTAVTGGPVLFSRTSPGPIRLSADGSLIALAGGKFLPPLPTTSSQFYRNGTLAGAVPGWAIGWAEGNRLLSNEYSSQGTSFAYTACSVYNDSGIKLATLPLPEMTEFQSLSADSIYSPENNGIYSLTTGAATWTSPSPSAREGAVAGPVVVFVSGATVRAEAY